ncbi:hypothetical protein JCM5296_005419 [Sporobolomyces johnsonii]
MAEPSTPSKLPPEIAILSNEAALYSIRRPQLQALTRQFGLKGTGKNVELIQRLQEHGRELARTPLPSNAADDSMLAADMSNTSWAIVSPSVTTAHEDVAESGVQGASFSSSEAVRGNLTLLYAETASPSSSKRSKSTVTSSSSSISIASTVRSAGTSLLRALVEPASPNKAALSSLPSPAPATSAVPSIYPSLKDAFERYSPQRRVSLAETWASDDDEMYENGGTRLVSSRSTIHTTSSSLMDVEEETPPVPALPAVVASPSSSAAPTPAFIFGSPAASPSNATPAFTFAMPGGLPPSLLSSTDSCDDPASGKSAAELVLEEMNRRAMESRAASGGSGLSSRNSSGVGRREAESPAKGSKAEFDGKHKRQFDKMDSITNHYAAKRPHPSSTNLANMARSSSSRTLTASTDRPVKRLKPSPSKPSGLNRAAPSTNADKKLVNALRAAGWSAPATSTSVSLASSVRGGSTASSSLKGKGKVSVREDIKPDAEREKEERKRKLELAKARRKSQAGGAGISRRRPSTVIGPKPSGLTASRFLKSTFKRFAPSSLSSRPAPTPVTSTSSAAKPLPSSISVPRFAASTASSSSRAGLVAAAAASSTTSPKKQPGWKKFDLQESLKRPMSWKTHLGSEPRNSLLSGKPAASIAPSLSVSRLHAPSSTSKRPLARQPSARVANPSLLGAVKAGTSTTSASTTEERSTASSMPTPPVELGEDPLGVAAKLASLPSAPSAFFTSTPSATASSSSLSLASPMPFRPVTNSPLPSTSSSSWQPPAVNKKPVLSSPAKKTVSSSTRVSRAGEKGRGKAQIEGLESRARKVRASKAKA